MLQPDRPSRGDGPCRRSSGARLAAALIATSLAFGACGSERESAHRRPGWSLGATVETVPVPNPGDAADDPAIWVHPDDPALSTVIGTDKQGGLAVYDLAGQQLQYLPDGKLNNVDVRYGFPLDGRAVALVTAGNRTEGTIALYRVDPATRRLERVAAGATASLPKLYGSCMYRSATTGKFYSFVTSESGAVEQWELRDDGAGRVDVTRVRSFSTSSKSEGCVADDPLGHLYVAEEDVGIWKYGAEPAAGDARRSVDTTGAGGHLTADVEGLAIYDAGDGRGYLIASSQGSDGFVIYRREGGNAYVATFAIGKSDGIDAVSVTDGIEVTSANLGPAFPRGVFVAQDHENENTNQNFKYVPWPAIAAVIDQASGD